MKSEFLKAVAANQVLMDFPISHCDIFYFNAVNIIYGFASTDFGNTNVSLARPCLRICEISDM